MATQGNALPLAHRLIQGDDYGGVKRLIVQDQSLVHEAGGPWGWTPLMAAADRGHGPIAQLLLAAGARVNAADFMEDTALHIASSRGWAHLVPLLLRYGADPCLRDGWGSTPLALAAANGHETAARALLTPFLPPTPSQPQTLVALTPAMQHQHEQQQKQHPRRLSLSSSGSTSFSSSAAAAPAANAHHHQHHHQQQPEPASPLKRPQGGGAAGAEAGWPRGRPPPPPTPPTPPTQCPSLLHPVVEAVNAYGRAPLWRAACGGHVGVCRLLLEAGADPRREDDMGIDARTIALDRDRHEVVCLIDEWMQGVGGTQKTSGSNTSSSGSGSTSSAAAMHAE